MDQITQYVQSIFQKTCTTETCLSAHFNSGQGQQIYNAVWHEIQNNQLRLIGTLVQVRPSFTWTSNEAHLKSVTYNLCLEALYIYFATNGLRIPYLEQCYNYVQSTVRPMIQGHVNTYNDEQRRSQQQNTQGFVPQNHGNVSLGAGLFDVQSLTSNIVPITLTGTAQDIYVDQNNHMGSNNITLPDINMPIGNLPLGAHLTPPNKNTQVNTVSKNNEALRLVTDCYSKLSYPSLLEFITVTLGQPLYKEIPPNGTGDTQQFSLCLSTTPVLLRKDLPLRDYGEFVYLPPSEDDELDAVEETLTNILDVTNITEIFTNLKPLQQHNTLLYHKLYNLLTDTFMDFLRYRYLRPELGYHNLENYSDNIEGFISVLKNINIYEPVTKALLYYLKRYLSSYSIDNLAWDVSKKDLHILLIKLMVITPTLLYPGVLSYIESEKILETTTNDQKQYKRLFDRDIDYTNILNDFYQKAFNMLPEECMFIYLVDSTLTRYKVRKLGMDKISLQYFYVEKIS